MNQNYFEKWNRKKSIYMFLTIISLIGPLLYSFKFIPSLQLLSYNFTRSAPIGLYITCFDQNISKGDYVILVPPEEAKQYLYGRHWTVAPFLLKQVSGLPGDQYSVNNRSLTLDNKSAPIYENDPDGLPVKCLPDGQYIVPEKMVLLISWQVPKSFDSRYFGPIDRSLIVRKVVPFLTLPLSMEKYFF